MKGVFRGGRKWYATSVMCPHSLLTLYEATQPVAGIYSASPDRLTCTEMHMRNAIELESLWREHEQRFHRYAFVGCLVGQDGQAECADGYKEITVRKRKVAIVSVAALGVQLNGARVTYANPGRFGRPGGCRTHPPDASPKNCQPPFGCAA